VPVIGGDQGHCPRGFADPLDDGGEHVGKLGADDEEPFGVGLGGSDLQERDEFTGGRQPVLHQAVVTDLQKLLDPDACESKDLHRGPCPERVLLLVPEVAALAAGNSVHPDLGSPANSRALGEKGPRQRLACGGEGVSEFGLPGGLQEFLGCLAAAVDRSDQNGKDGEPFAGSGVHAGFAAPYELAVADFVLADGADRKSVV
jgi:hypothetical protein